MELYLSCIRRKKGKAKKENEAIGLGVALEPLIRQEFAIDYPNFIVRSPKGYEMYRRRDKTFMTATLDGTITDKLTKEKLILEIKTHDIRNREDEEKWTNGIPDNYFIQVLHYLLVMTDYSGAILVARMRHFDYYAEGGKKLLKVEYRYYRIDRKDEAIQKWLAYLEKAETEFWENNVKKRIPPQILTQI